MKVILSCVHIIVSVVLILAVLVQQRKQGGFSGVFGGGTQADNNGQWQRFTPLTKLTIILAAVFMVTSFFIVFLN
ncbi:MAG: preprotein translocase subunit SecG [Synergistaceae bacterium]|nr:preprotein translocase subunit SecG [Synergistaceae bacterium]